MVGNLDGMVGLGWVGLGFGAAPCTEVVSKVVVAYKCPLGREVITPIGLMNQLSERP